MLRRNYCLIIIFLFAFLILLPFSSTSFGAEVELSWDQNQETELAGYFVYYGTSSQNYFENSFKLPKESLVEADGRVSYQFPIDLTPGVTYYFAVTAYDIQDFETDFSNEVQYLLLPEGEQDTTPPTGSILINNGDDVTHSQNVTLTLFATDDGEELDDNALMTFSNDNAEWSDPEFFANTKTWALSPGEGIKTVYVKFRDATGNWMTEPAQDQISYEESQQACDDPQILQPVSITASSEFLPAFFSKEKLIDGDPRTFWSTIPSFSQKDEFVTLDLGEIKMVRWFNMYALDLFGIDFFPVNFKIEISRDNIAWEEMSSEAGFNPNTQTTSADSWDFGSLECRYIRIYITESKTLFFSFHLAQIAEIRVYGCDLPEHTIFTGEERSSSETERAKEDDQKGKTISPGADQRLPSTPGKPEVRFK